MFLVGGIFIFMYACILLYMNKQDQEGSLLKAAHRAGQTFLTWEERTDVAGEVYRIYRSAKPITQSNFHRAAMLVEVGENSAIFYANRAVDTSGNWYLRLTERFIIEPNGEPLPPGTGLFVWTLSSEDFKEEPGGEGYYAVTVILPGGEESFNRELTSGPVDETVADPLPVEVTNSVRVQPGEGGHVYLQYMDFRNWNATFHAPNVTNFFYGLSPETPGMGQSLQYAYDYTVYEPLPADCGGVVPEKLPVYVFLHGWRGNRYAAYEANPYPYCAYGILPVDVSQTWYFGFAKNHDYRLGTEIEAGDVIANFTEQRVLRMIYDLERFPPGPEVDKQRIYVFGHSMGGSGSLAFAERYPNVFAAAYASQPITDYRTAGVTEQDWAADVALKWGSPGLNLPVSLSAPAGWAGHLQRYNGVGVWDWQNYLAFASLPGLTQRQRENTAPFGIDHGIPDEVIIWATQGQPVYPALDAGRLAWAGAVTDTDHEWANFLGLPPTMGNSQAPFWNFQVIREESVPGLSKLSGNAALPPDAPGSYNQTILWSASWNPWDGAPVDQPDRWIISLCSVAAGSQTCGSGELQTVDITPRRLQNFVVLPNEVYNWENRSVADNRLITSGTVTADDLGLVTVRDFEVSPAGNRLVLTKAP